VVSEGLLERMQQVGELHDCKIEIVSFARWYELIISSMSDTEILYFNNLWLTAIAESFGQRRREIAPIDEPCGLWMETLLKAF